jgi:hypothetical protein
MRMLDLIIAGRQGTLVLGSRHADLHHPLHATVDGADDEFVQRHLGVTQHAPEHRHVDTGDDPRVHAVGHRHRGATGRGAEDIGQDQHVNAFLQAQAAGAKELGAAIRDAIKGK